MQKKILIIVFLSLIVSYIGYELNYKSYLQAKGLQKSTIKTYDSAKDMENTFKEILSYRALGNWEAKKRMYVMSRAIFMSNYGKKEIFYGFIDYSVTELKKELSVRPKDYKCCILLSTLLIALAENDKKYLPDATNYTKYCARLSPKQHLTEVALNNLRILNAKNR